MNLTQKLILGNAVLLIIFTILIFKVEKNIFIWLCFYFLGCSLFALIVKNADKNPDKNKRHHKVLLKTSEDDGIFEYTETGFYIWNNDFITMIEWYEILRITVQKTSVLENIHTELLMETVFGKIIINDSMHGWEKFISKIDERLLFNKKNNSANSWELKTNIPIIIYQK
ncbi:hypothetical protein [Chryseobacterium sp. MYb328]|uniref:hypothetical protein n=1 Tax=Chryseobacterium sp. MYb328 TaxID=2745231 RepID=UPI00309B5E3F